MSSHSETIHMRIDPLAVSVDGISQEVSGTTSAVVAMESAVIYAERQARNKICQNVNNGFYSLITSQISQKLAIHQNAAEARLGMMLSLTKKLREVQETAEKDYQRISRRYMELFRNLDNNLKNRIAELNKPAVILAEKKKSLIFKTPVKNAAAAICYEKETQPVTQMLVNCELKKHANLALECLSDTLEEERDYDQKMGPILHEKKLNDVQNDYVPVIVAESVSLHQASSSIWNSIVPQDDRLSEANLIGNNCVAEAKEGQWVNVSEDERRAVVESVMQLPEFEALDARVAGEIQKLLNQNGWLTWVDGGAE